MKVEEHWEKQGNKIILEYEKKHLSEDKQQLLGFNDNKFCFETPLKSIELKEFSEKYENYLQKFHLLKQEFLKNLTIDKQKGDESSNEAYAFLGKLAKDDKEKNENNSNFIEKLTFSAQCGNLNAQQTLSTIYSSGPTAKYYSLDINPEKSMYYTKLAALSNEDVIALTNMGIISELDEDEKLPVLIKAASKGYPHAMLEVGTYFYEKEMYQEAFIWFTCGMNRGHGASCLEIGGCYLKGFGVEKNEKLGNQLIAEAKKWDHSLESFDEKMLEIEKNSGRKIETTSPILDDRFEEDLVLEGKGYD